MPAHHRAGADYQLKVIIRDMDAYQELLLNRITRIEGVTGVHQLRAAPGARQDGGAGLTA